MAGHLITLLLFEKERNKVKNSYKILQNKKICEIFCMCEVKKRLCFGLVAGITTCFNFQPLNLNPFSILILPPCIILTPSHGKRVSFPNLKPSNIYMHFFYVPFYMLLSPSKSIFLLGKFIRNL